MRKVFPGGTAGHATHAFLAGTVGWTPRAGWPGAGERGPGAGGRAFVAAGPAGRPAGDSADDEAPLPAQSTGAGAVEMGSGSPGGGTENSRRADAR